MRPLAVGLWALAALAVAMGIGRFAFTPILPMMQGDSGIGVVEGGWLASANYVGYLVGALSAVALAWTPGVAVRVGLAAVGLSTLAMGFTVDMAAWLGLRFVGGVASAWVLVFATSWSLEQIQVHADPQARPLLGATVFAGVGTGIAVAGAVCLLLILDGRGSRSAWIVLGVLALVVTFVLPGRFGAVAALHGRAPETIPEWPRGSLRLAAVYGAFGFGYIIPATFLSTMARDLARDPALYGWSWPIFGLAAVTSTFAAARLRRMASDRTLWIGGHGIMAVGVIAPLWAGGLGGILASALLVGGTFMVVTMAGIQEARRIAGPAARRLIAAMTAAFAAGQIAGPLLVSALSARGHGYGAALWIAGATLLVGALALLPRER